MPVLVSLGQQIWDRVIRQKLYYQLVGNRLFHCANRHGGCSGYNLLRSTNKSNTRKAQADWILE